MVRMISAVRRLNVIFTGLVFPPSEENELILSRYPKKTSQTSANRRKPMKLTKPDNCGAETTCSYLVVSRSARSSTNRTSHADVQDHHRTSCLCVLIVFNVVVFSHKTLLFLLVLSQSSLITSLSCSTCLLSYYILPLLLPHYAAKTMKGGLASTPSLTRSFQKSDRRVPD